jgi:hypothetical protein
MGKQGRQGRPKMLKGYGLTGNKGETANSLGFSWFILNPGNATKFQKAANFLTELSNPEE